MKNTVEYKYPIGKTIYFLDRSKAHRKYKCPTCLGSGKLLRNDGSEIECLSCYGKGEITDYGEYIYSVECSTIDEVSIYVYRDSIEFSYSVARINDDMSNYYGEKELYETEEEAQKTCDKLNKNLKFDE